MRTLTLGILAKRLGWSRDHISKILNGAGFRISSNPINPINDNQLSVIAIAYRTSMREKRQYSVKKINYLNLFDRLTVGDYFSQFMLKTDDKLTQIREGKLMLDEVSDVSFERDEFDYFIPTGSFQLSTKIELDDSLIDQYFYDLAFGLTNLEREFRLFKRHYRIWAKQFLLLNNFRDLRKIISNLILHNHFHIFSSEEENTGAAQSEKNPSISGNILIPVEAWLNRIIINLTQSILWIRKQKTSSLSI